MDIKKMSLKKSLPYILILAGLVGLVASFILTIDTFKVLQDPSYKPSCNLNPVLSCGSVINSKQGEIFGFPNPIAGLAAFGGLFTVGIAMLAAPKFKKWWYQGLNLGAFGGILFVHWLFYQTVYRIHSLCPFCLGVWVATITTFWYVTLYNIDEGIINLPKGLKKYYPWVRKHHFDILILWFLIIFALILKHFWYYYGRGL